jgi:hypothetical protein
MVEAISYSKRSRSRRPSLHPDRRHTMNEQTFLKRNALQKDEWPDIQALAVTALSHHPFGRYVLLQFGNSGGGQTHPWLASLAKRITPIQPKAEARSHKTHPVRNVAAGPRADSIGSRNLPVPISRGHDRHPPQPHTRRPRSGLAKQVVLGRAGEQTVPPSAHALCPHKRRPSRAGEQRADALE